jgi:hypothetical protein
MNELIKSKQNEKTNRHHFQPANEHFIEEPWVTEEATERVERLQSNSALNYNDKKKHNNQALFVSKFYQRLKSK